MGYMTDTEPTVADTKMACGARCPTQNGPGDGGGLTFNVLRAFEAYVYEKLAGCFEVAKRATAFCVMRVF